MKKPIAAIAAFVLGTTLLSGCFVVPPFWWGPDHGGRWEGHHHGRHGALTPEEQHRTPDDHARRGETNDRDG